MTPSWKSRNAGFHVDLSIESETNAQFEYDKFNRVDLLVEDAQSALIFIEIQHNRETHYLKCLLYGVHSKQPLQLARNPPRSRRRKRQVISARTFYPEYYLIEVERFQNIIQNGIDEWVYFFKNSEIKDEFQSKNIQQAREKLDVLKMSAEERHAYEEFLVARAAQDDILQTARTEGKAEGERDKAHQIARSMRQEGLDPAMIAKITGLSLAEISALSKAE